MWTIKQFTNYTLQNIKALCVATTRLDWWLEWGGIILGCCFVAIGFVVFINPYNIVPGGVYGLSIVMHNVFPSIQVGTFGYLFDVPLLILSMIFLGSQLGARTIVAALLTPAIMNTLSWLAYPNSEALQQLDPTQLFGGNLNMTHDLLLTCIIGAVFIGLGCGIVVRNQATTGGSDIIAMFLQKYAHIPFSKALLMVDACIVLSGLIVFTLNGTSEKSYLLSFYSLIAIFVTSRVVAFAINGNKDDKILFVISEQKLDELHHYILNDMDRTATCIKSSGLYTGKENSMLFMVVTNKEVMKMKIKIKEVDPRAFVIVTDAYDTFGERWKPLPSAGEIHPE